MTQSDYANRTLFSDFMKVLCRNLNYLGIFCLAGIMLLTAADVSLRYFFNSPLTGSNEVTELLLLISVMTGIVHAASDNRHIAIDTLTNILPPNAKNLASALTNGLLVLLFATMTWKMTEYSFMMRGMNRTTIVLMFPVWPFVMAMAAGFALVSLSTLANLLGDLLVLAKSPLRLALWLVLIAVLAGGAWFIISQGRQLPVSLTPLVAGVIGLTMLCALMLLGVPVMAALIITGLIGICYLRGTKAGLTTLASIPFTTLTSYTFSAIPLFVLMGEICYFAGIGTELYNMAYRWFGHMRGGLAIGTVAACGGFAAVCGDSMATAVTMGTVAVPEMRKYNYKMSLAAGVVAAGGTLGVLIPPSLAFILYALLADQSLSTLFIAGILPGFILILLFMATVRFLTWRNPSIGPAGPRSTWRERFHSLRGIWAVILLFVFVIGGMYTGMFTPTEGAGVGAFSTLLVSVVRRKLSWKGFISSLQETSKIAAVCMSILVGANIFGVFLATSKLPMELAETVASMDVPRTVTLLVILLVYLLLGTIMPAIPMLILTVPIFLPVVSALGYNLIWYGVLMVIMFEMAVITPPMGINVLALRSIIHDCTILDMFKGTMPFLAAIILLLFLLLVFPEIPLLLPNLLGTHGL